MEFSGKNTGVGCHFLLQENVLLHLKGRAESVLALGLTDASGSRHHQGPRLFPAKGHGQYPPTSTVSLSSNSREKAPSAKLLRRMRTILTESPQQISSHISLTLTKSHDPTGTTHWQGDCSPSDQSGPPHVTVLTFLKSDQLPVGCVGCSGSWRPDRNRRPSCAWWRWWFSRSVVSDSCDPMDCSPPSSSV